MRWIEYAVVLEFLWVLEKVDVVFYHSDVVVDDLNSGVLEFSDTVPVGGVWELFPSYHSVLLLVIVVRLISLVSAYERVPV